VPCEFVEHRLLFLFGRFVEFHELLGVGLGAVPQVKACARKQSRDLLALEAPGWEQSA
jgi:hypothetical protein